MKITILTDNQNSWFIPYGTMLQDLLINKGFDAKYIFKKEEIRFGDVCFLLSCSNIVNSDYLRRNTNNIVVHASDLPKGKGFAPLQWQVLEGRNTITLTLFEAVNDFDAGPYYFKDTISLVGHELYFEMRNILAEKIINMCIHFIENKTEMNPISQNGIETFYRRRTQKDDEIDINKSILEQFNHFRIADNNNFPLWFTINEHKYYLKIFKNARQDK